MTDYVIQRDAAEFLKEHKGAADFIFADPPYNLQLPANSLTRPEGGKVAGVRETWDDIADYASFSREWLEAAKGALKQDGQIAVMGDYHNIYQVGAVMQEFGFFITAEISWCKPNPMPNFKGTRLCPDHETIIVARLGRKSTLNYWDIKLGNGGKQGRTTWFIPVCPQLERLKTRNGEKLHSTQKPLALLSRIVLAFTKTGDLILDPFSGTGTTGAAAVRYQRRFAGADSCFAYIAPANRRIKAAALNTFPSGGCEREETPRISFADVVALCELDGATLVHEDKYAKVRADGLVFLLEHGNYELRSIHQAAAEVCGSPQNGWTYWEVIDNGKAVSLNEFRKKAFKLFTERKAKIAEFEL